MKYLIEKFSPSMLIDYLNCPKLFYYRYIAKIQLPQKQIHLLFGESVHAGIEEMYDDNDPLPVFKEKFDKKRLGQDEKDLYDEHIKLGIEMLTNYKKIHNVLNNLYDLNKGKSELYIRRKLRNPLTNEETDIPISGRIDRITDSTRIIEYKTSKNKWKETDVNYKIQTLLYNLWFYSEFNKLPLETIYIILLKKFKEKDSTEIHQVFSKHCSIVELAGVFEEVQLILHKINSHEFDRPKGYHPPYCDCYKYEEVLNFNNQY